MSPVRTITPVILSGGSGTRLWPLSRTGRPKQLLALTHAETMLQLTGRRVCDPNCYDPPIVVANAQHAAMIEEQLGAVGLSASTLIFEPMARNTAPAIALAALAAPKNAILLVMPSDHVIEDGDAFQEAVTRAVPLVDEGWLVTFGIAPSGPETGYGYIQMGRDLAAGVQQVESFVEKPDRSTAERYLAEGNYAWNGGIFLFRADAYIEALARYAPEMLQAADDAMAKADRSANHIYPDAQTFGASPSDSIDYAVMEKAERVAVVPVEMGWSDVGSWDALHELSSKDSTGNAHKGEVVAIDTEHCFIRTEGPLVAAVGVKDLIVIATGDAVLILPRGSSQDVKRAIERLKLEGHITLDRPL
jgi:mannose-1-phosphate guanylyltransferase/mannose-1-phosphate guanylyltransferase/mannose-6-phosphate isomerase